MRTVPSGWCEAALFVAGAVAGPRRGGAGAARVRVSKPQPQPGRWQSSAFGGPPHVTAPGGPAARPGWPLLAVRAAGGVPPWCREARPPSAGNLHRRAGRLPARGSHAATPFGPWLPDRPRPVQEACPFHCCQSSLYTRPAHVGHPWPRAVPGWPRPRHRAFGVDAEEVGEGAPRRGQRSQAGRNRRLGTVLVVIVEGVLLSVPRAVGRQAGQVERPGVAGGEFGASADEGQTAGFRGPPPSRPLHPRWSD